MKTALFFLLFGAILGAAGWRYYERQQDPGRSHDAASLANQGREPVHDAQGKVAGQADDWNLTPDNIKAELAKSGQVVRSKARMVGERIDDARIVAVIKGKYILDDQLSALAITVDCRDGDVHLNGSVTAPENIGRAVTIALETNGVHNVTSQLVIRN